MNRLVLMVLKNIWLVPSAYWKLCHYAKHTEEYSEEEKYRHIQYIFRRAVKSGNIDLQVDGVENIPKENGFMMYSNHQGMFDIMAISIHCEKPWAAVLKKRIISYTIYETNCRLYEIICYGQRGYQTVNESNSKCDKGSRKWT